MDAMARLGLMTARKAIMASGPAMIEGPKISVAPVAVPLQPPTPAPGNFTVTTALIIRSGPAITTKRLGLLNQGHGVQVAEHRGAYARIGKNRWVASRYLISNPDSAAAAMITGKGFFKYRAQTAPNSRSKPSIKGNKIGRLRTGQTVLVLEKNSRWARIGVGHWVATDFLSEITS